ncbi:hypothetical protein HHK36_022001 [Tetracentron sinense]|uniref:Uncharacterized protein n=1 Tax=Tetracentron sinense TaxID=13715 RepID=A0A834YNW0_TETSI|nr:hypothetical protein HHK36_022001 [Tetracentron sinense]
MFEATQDGLGRNAPVHSVHGSLLAVGELLRKDGHLKQTARKSFMRPWIVHPPPEPSVPKRMTTREYRASLLVPPPWEATHVVQPPQEPLRAIPLQVVPPPPVYIQVDSSESKDNEEEDPSEDSQDEESSEREISIDSPI